MSYTPTDTGDSINNLFHSLVDFALLAPHLLQAKNLQSFIVWFEKLELINRRSLLIYLREHKNEIPKKHLDFARTRFVQKI